MQTVTVHEAKTHLSRLLAAVESGDEVVVARGRTPIARIVPFEALTPKTRQLGWLRGDAGGSDPLAYGFWDPIPDDDLALWEGSVDYPDADAPAA